MKVWLVASGLLRGWLSVRERRRDAGKCDNLSFLGCVSVVNGYSAGRYDRVCPSS